MKREFLIYVWFAAITICGCEKTYHDISPMDEQQEEETIIVSLGLGGEITISDSPLSTKAAGAETESKDIYAINVCYDKEKDGITNDRYAAGLFDNINDMAITLLTGYKYSFDCTFIPNGKESKYYYDTETNYTFSPKAITNRFFADNWYSYMYFGTAIDSRIHYNKQSNYSPTSYQGYYGVLGVDRYYGEVSNYTPKAGDKVTIEMIRCVFGLRINVSGLTDGSLYLGRCFGDDHIRRIRSDGVVRDINYQAFIDVYKCWRSYQDYSITEPMTISWERGNGVTQDLGTQNITVKRNVLTTVRINLVGSSTDNSIGLDVKSGEMGNSTINININADGTIDTNVDPQH